MALVRSDTWPCSPRYHSDWTIAYSRSTGSRPPRGSTIIIPYMPLAMWWRAGFVPQWYMNTPALSAVNS
jgi:hypothetical protein